MPVMRGCFQCLVHIFVLLASTAVSATTGDRSVDRSRVVYDGIEAPSPADLQAAAARSRTSGAVFAGWLANGAALIAARHGDAIQIHRIDGPGAVPQRLTDSSDSIAAVTVPRRGSEGFLFGMDSNGTEDWQLYYYDLGANRSRRLSDGQSRNQGAVWAHDGSRFAYTTTRRNGLDADIHIMSAEGDSQPLVERGGGWLAQDWSPNDQALLVRQVHSLTHSRLWLVRISDGAMAPIGNDRAVANIGRALFAPDGQAIYYTSDEASEFRQLLRVDLRTGRRRILTRSIRWDIEDFALSGDGRHLALVVNENGYSRLLLRSLPDQRNIRLPAHPPGTLSLGGFDPSDRHLAFTLASTGEPVAVWTLSLGRNDYQRWTGEPTDPATSVRIEPEAIDYASFDRDSEGWRRRIPALYYRPPGSPPERGFPVLVSLHGGPEAQARPGFNPTIQHLVGELGIAVITPNVRGSTGYGKHFLALDDGLRREHAVRDVGALLDWIADQPELDADRIGVTGTSYGGYLALSALAHYGARLRAGASVVGISHLVTFLENTSELRRDLRRLEYGDERDPTTRAHLDRISPLTLAPRIKRPLLIAHGGNDPRVPVAEAERIVSAVRSNGVEVGYLLFPDEGHGFTRTSSRNVFEAISSRFWRAHLLDQHDE
ncbi:MAG TPA: hypothetical protein DDZ76_11255 [Xanthomonadales bacterium]|nr:hypothetical protein [Xanthomonadales bacterium]